MFFHEHFRPKQIDDSERYLAPSPPVAVLVQCTAPPWHTWFHQTCMHLASIPHQTRGGHPWLCCQKLIFQEASFATQKIWMWGSFSQRHLRPTSKRSWWIQVSAFLFLGRQGAGCNIPVLGAAGGGGCNAEVPSKFLLGDTLQVWAPVARNANRLVSTAFTGLIVCSGITSQGNFLHQGLPCLSLLSGNPIVNWIDALTSELHTCCSLSSTLHLILTCSSRLCFKINSPGSLLRPFLSNEGSNEGSCSRHWTYLQTVKLQKRFRELQHPCALLRCQYYAQWQA